MIRRSLMMLSVSCISAAVALTPVRCRAAMPAPFPAPLAAHVPGDALIYFGWSGPVAKWPEYKTSNLHIVLSHTDIAKFIQGNLPIMLNRLDAIPKFHNIPQLKVHLEQTVAIGALFMTHPFAIYFRPISTGIRHVAPLPQVVLIMKAEKSASAVEAIFKKIPSPLYPGGPRVRTGTVGSIVYVGIHLTPGVTRALAGRDAALWKSEKFDNTMRLLNFSPNRPVLAEFADLSRMRKYLNELLDVAVRNAGKRNTHVGIRRRHFIGAAKSILKVQSIRNATAFAAADGFSGAQWLEAAFLAMRHGAAAPTTGAADMLALAPKKSPDVSVSDVNLGHVVGTLEKIIEAASPQGRYHVEQAITMLNGITGVDVRKDIIDALGSYWLTYQSPEMPMTSALGEVVVNRLAHPKRMALSLQTLAPMALLAVNAAMRQHGYKGPPAQLKILHSHGAVIYYLKATGIMPAYAIAHGKLYFSAYPRPIQRALARPVGAPSILDNKKFIALQKLLGGPTSYTSAAFIDEPRLLSGSYNTITTQVATYSLLLGLQLDPPISSIIPRLSDLQKATTTSGRVTWTDAAGWHSRSISGYPGSGLFVP